TVLRVAVEDSGPGMDQNGSLEDPGAGVGLQNVKRRLELCFGARSDLVIDSSTAGTTVRFSVPLDKAAPIVA
ncbi:MAG: hypothetical protein ACREMY_18490, partial [bacterium]